MTHRHAAAREAFAHIFASAGALAFMHAYTASAAPPALSHAFAERQQACPLTPRYPRRSAHTGSHPHPKPGQPVLASPGRRRTTRAASQPLAPPTGSVGASPSVLKRGMPGARLSARAATDHPARWAEHARQGLACPPGATRMASGSAPSSRSLWPRTVPRFPRAGPQRLPPMPHSRSRSSSTTATRAPPPPRQRRGGAPVRVITRLTRALTHSCPQVLPWCPDKETAILGDVLRRWPTLTAAHLARRTPLEGCCRAPHGRAADEMPTRIAARKRPRARTTDDGVRAPPGLRGHGLVAPRRGT